MIGTNLQEIKQLTGSVQLRRGKWHCVINLYDERGERKPKWINTELPERGNKRKAEKLLAEWLEYYTEKRSPSSNNTLLSDYAAYWLEHLIDSIEQSTWESYENVVNNHIIPYFANKKLALVDVAANHIRDYYDHKKKKGRKDGKNGGLSYETLKKHSSILKLILRDAVEMNVIPASPAENVKVKSKVEEKKDNLDDATFLNAEDANTVLAGFDGDFLQPLIYVTLNYGLRRSETLGLRWSALDFEKETLEINHTVVKHKTTIKKDRTKNKASHGIYALSSDAKEIFLKIKAQQEADKKSFGREYHKSDYIFTWPDGHEIRPDYVTKRFQKVLENVGLPHMRFHDLRHSCASILYDKGWNVKDIQAWLRHSKLETTMDIYD